MPPRVPQLKREDAPEAIQREYDRLDRETGRMTNMKRTLGHSPIALRALMEWYPLRDEVRKFLPERSVILFVHAISNQTDCLICHTFFRRVLIQRGEDPDHLTLDAREQLLVDYGRQLAVDSNAVSDELWAKLTAFITPENMVTLTTWGGVMVATNILNNALRVHCDTLLVEFLQDKDKTDDRAVHAE